jgi:hypothetical protein
VHQENSSLTCTCMQALKILFCVSKTDCANALSATEVGMLVGLPELQDELCGRLTVVRLSNTSSTALSEVWSFLKACARST